MFRCKRGFPKALFCQLTKNGVTPFESTCEHQDKQSNYYLPKNPNSPKKSKDQFFNK